MVLAWLAFMAMVIWIWLIAFRDEYWRADQRLDRYRSVADWPSIAIIIPARNEAASISPVLRSHLQTDYPGKWSLVLVNDHSNDNTQALAEEALDGEPRATIVMPPALPDGWSGKIWAQKAAIDHIATHGEGDGPVYFLMTDADIVHAPSTLRKLVSRAEHDQLAMVSLMARLDARGFWGGLLIPAFVYFFMKLYPFAGVNRRSSPLAGAAGGCMLVRADRLKAVGSVDAIKEALIDDCALATLMKNGTRDKSKSVEPSERTPIFLGIADQEVVSLRDNQSLSTIWAMVSRTAFSQLDHSAVKLLISVLGMVIVYMVAPFVWLTWPFHGQSYAFGYAMIAATIMLVSYLPIMLVYRRPVWWCLTLPMAAFVYTLMTISSAWQYWRGAGNAWKGRHYKKQTE